MPYILRRRSKLKCFNSNILSLYMYLYIYMLCSKTYPSVPCTIFFILHINISHCIHITLLIKRKTFFSSFFTNFICQKSRLLKQTNFFYGAYSCLICSNFRTINFLISTEKIYKLIYLYVINYN